MTHEETMLASFRDELTKIAGESRFGRRPVSVDRLLEREAADDMTPSEFAPSGVKLSATPHALLAAGLTGAGLYHLGRKANQDRQLGRAMRLQQAGQGY